jgi:hypothetical protein
MSESEKELECLQLMLMAGKYIVICPDCYKRGRITRLSIDDGINFLLDEKDKEIQNLNGRVKYLERVKDSQRKSIFELDRKIQYYENCFCVDDLVDVGGFTAKAINPKKIFEVLKENEALKKETVVYTNKILELEKKFSTVREEVCGEIEKNIDDNRLNQYVHFTDKDRGYEEGLDVVEAIVQKVREGGKE